MEISKIVDIEKENRFFDNSIDQIFELNQTQAPMRNEITLKNTEKDKDSRMDFSLGPQPAMIFNGNKTVDTEQILIEEGNPEEEKRAEQLLAMNSFNSRLQHETSATFVVEKGEDGKIIPLQKRPAEENQKLYLQKYGTYVNLPSLYILDAVFNNKFPDYCIQLAKCVLPGKEDYLVHSHYLDGSSSVKSFQQIEKLYSRGLILRLLFREKSQLIVEKEIILEGVWKSKIKFSNCGNFFVMIIPQDKQNSVQEQIRLCRLYRTKDIHDIMLQIENHHYKVHYTSVMLPKKNISFDAQNMTPKFDLRFVENIIFDQEIRFIIGYGKTKFIIYNIKKSESKIYQIDKLKYEQIYDMGFNSSSDEDFKCVIACKRKGVNQIAVFDFFESQKQVRFDDDPSLELKPQIRLFLNFEHKPSKLLKVKISFDFRTCVFTDIHEKFIVEQKDGYTIQRKLGMLTGKIVHYIFQSRKDFYFVQSKDFDGSLKVSHQNREKKIFKVKRNIEPGIMKMFDFDIQVSNKQDEKGYFKKEFRMIGMQDEDFMYDKVLFDEKLIDAENVTKQVFEYQNIRIQSYIFSYMRAQSTSWPYFSYSGFSNYLLLINAFNRKFIQRIQLADESQNISICDTYISDTYDLFILILHKGCYKLYMIDLDRANILENEESEIDDHRSPYSITDPIFCYHADDVDNRNFMSMHVRGSSRKEALDRNEKQFVYFLHSGYLYSWIKLNEESKHDKIKPVCPNSSTQFYLIKDGLFIFLQDDVDSNNKLVEQKIIKLQTNFSQYQLITEVKRISGSGDKITALMMDQVANLIIFVTQKKQVTAESDRLVTKFKLFDMDANKPAFEIELKNEILIGRLISGLCTVINGHIYFNNNLVKIRYDLCLGQKNYKFTENDIFDFYSEIFDLPQNITIRSKTPVKSIRYHRVVYITRDLSHKEPQQIIILPFLHEKRIYLNRIKNNSYYFYSSIDTPVSDVRAHNQKVLDSVEPMLSKESSQFENLRKMKQISERQNLPKDKTRTVDTVESNTSIICMNLTESKYYVYGTDGILEYRVDYSEHEQQYGQPIGTSSSGQYFIFRKSREDLDNIQYLSDEQMIEHFMTIHILKLTVFSFDLVKKINVYQNIKEYLLKQKDRDSLKNLNWLYNLKYEDIDSVDFSYVVNDKTDVCIRVNKKTDLDYDQDGQRLDRHEIELNIPDHKTQYSTIYYYENGLYDNEEKEGTVMQSVFVTNMHGGVDYIINKQNLFFWSDQWIKFCYLKDGISDDKKFIQANFRQDNIEKFSYFKDLRTASDPNMFVFIVHQSPGNNSIFTWFTKENAEAEAYDVSEEYELLWDKLGNLYIITDNKVIFNRQRCSIKTYDFQDLFATYRNFKLPKNVLDNKRGHRFDFKNHNWLIYKEYISLPFSYITFMIKSKIEKKDPCLKTNYFDPVPYDYIFNKGTSFTDSEFVKKDSKETQRVLQNFERIDPCLLELLIYNQAMVFAVPHRDLPGVFVHEPAGSNTPLYLAVRENNNRCVDIILQYMTKIKFNSSRNFMNVFPSLVNYQNFLMYIDNLPIQTALMKQKQVLRVKDTYNNKIVKICESPCVNIDDKFYSQMMEEQEIGSPNYKSFPVKVVAFRFAWLILNPEGKEFLQSIFKNENLMFYRVVSLQMIIEFLYLKYKDVLLTKLLPAFVVQAVLFQALVASFEGYYSVYKMNSFKDEQGQIFYQGSSELIGYKIAAYLLLFLNVGMSGILINFQWLLIKNMGIPYFQRFYSLVDIAYIMMNLIIFIICFVQLATDHLVVTKQVFQNSTSTQRTFEVICIFLIYIKAGYFLSLIDSIAPLMDSISQVFVSIRSFTFLLLMYIIAFSSCFYLLGQNQLYFDDISDLEMETIGIPYDTFGHSIWYVYLNYMMGGKFYRSFNLGKRSQRPFLYALFIIASCYIDIILLKMLIAIMNSSFASRKSVAEEIKVKDHLRFLLDNWHLMDFALKDKSQVTYIISAFAVNGVQQKDSQFEGIQENIDQIDLQSSDNFKKLQYDINQVNLIVQTLLKQK